MNGRIDLCFTFLPCELGTLWNLILNEVLRTLKSCTGSPDLPALDEPCFGNGRDSECQNPKSIKPKVLGFSEIRVIYKHCLGQKCHHILSGLNFPKQTSRISKVNYLSIVIVLIHSV
uniref:Uncharacterized protein n=1 Tax=Prolemur simus TaxID=1328070 RepID=A0A8C8YWW2_PROSS